jgi:hypothetical protein
MRGRFSVALVLSLSLAGCVSSAMITSRTVGYNKVVEDSNNQVLLLNVVRARFRHPMYFTGLTLLRGSQSVQVGTGSSLPFGGEAPSIFTVNPNANLNINPSYDVAVLDTKEFMSGITTPVDMKTLKYYWDQGWSRQMLLFLFVRRIELGNRCFLNVPWNAADEGCDPGVPKLNEYLDKKLDIVEDPAPRRTAVGPPIQLAAGQAPGVGDIVNAYVNKLTLAKEKGKENVYQLYSESKGFIFQFCPEPRECDAKSRQHVAIASDSDNPDEKKPKIFIRSPEAVLFFLGEIAREELEGRLPPQMLTSGNDKIPLFVVRRSSTPPVGAALTVEYEGEWYYIPSGPEGGRSMHVLSLVNQILSLHKSRPELPSTSAVTVVGR